LKAKKLLLRLTHTNVTNLQTGLPLPKKTDKIPTNHTKRLLRRAKAKNYFVFVIPIAEELDLKKAAKSVGEKSVEMIHVKDINKITGYIRGGCSPLGMKKQFVTVVDDSAKNHDKIIISGGRIGSQIILAPDDLLKAINGKYDDITKK
jgi:Cys-tRNA(Pro)/Cys-tRNA(Cys) deacylase